MDVEEALKALSHAGRMEFVAWLKDPEQTFCLSKDETLIGVSAGCFERNGLSQSAVSSHLAILKRAGLLHAKRVGNSVRYRRNEEMISRLKIWLAENL
ncbi:ArsR/SmtB family transcription factor [Rhizobium rosettiformans]|uniref:ArsR/SmtB family transcription factor n=1 Tax=Rhizobium rosettiformans TaxID=1368430 RepID=UPI0028567AB0|nr:helix-turn-helix transcriptional regulator [Rhizobium rosettiformans]MDR7031281.1 ArsR family transcriptional regulator [Rhizobium rosettiformans]MDR7067152.1 ArsR family transcriptional regulator [Rhizobium rosettiformans]